MEMWKERPSILGLVCELALSCLNTLSIEVIDLLLPSPSSSRSPLYRDEENVPKDIFHTPSKNIPFRNPDLDEINETDLDTAIARKFFVYKETLYEVRKIHQRTRLQVKEE